MSLASTLLAAGRHHRQQNMHSEFRQVHDLAEVLRLGRLSATAQLKQLKP